MEPQSLGAGEEKESGIVVGFGFFFLPLFYSKVFLHMTQTSLNFPKLQSLLMARPQSGRENVKRGERKKQNKKTVCEPVERCVGCRSSQELN